MKQWHDETYIPVLCLAKFTYSAPQFKVQVKMGGVRWVHDKVLPSGRMVPSVECLNSASEWSGAMVSLSPPSVQSFTFCAKGSIRERSTSIREAFNMQICKAPNHTVIDLSFFTWKRRDNVYLTLFEKLNPILSTCDSSIRGWYIRQILPFLSSKLYIISLFPSERVIISGFDLSPTTPRRYI